MFDKRLLALVPEARVFVVLSVLGKWAALVAYAVFAVALARFLAALSSGTLEEAAFFIWLGVSCAAIAARFLCLAGADYAGSKAASLGKAKVRAEVYDKVISLGLAYKEEAGTAQVVQLCGEGAEKLQMYLGQYLPQLFYAVLAPVTLFALFLCIDVPVAVVLLICVPLIPVAIVLIMKIAKRAMGGYWDSYVDLGGLFFESISALTTLKLFRADERQQRIIDEQSEGFRQTTMRLLRMQLNSVTVMDLFTFGGAAVGLTVALFHAQAGMLSLSGALVIVLLAIEFFMPMRVLGSYFHTAMGAAPVLDQVFNLLAVDNPHRGSKTLDAEEIEITCSSVGYRYGTTWALRDASFTIEPNTFVGITGESGSGKSTLAKLLAGELVDYSGSAKVNGIELRDIEPASLRRAITYVSADAYIFKGTFRSNLLMANASANDYELWRVLGRCHLDDFVLEQGGLDAPIAVGGANLSGGQRQRLAVARALLRDTPLYLFDEATANVDADSERELMACIQQLSLEKTVVVISHRLSAIAWADNILVFQQGALAEQGTHGELAVAAGSYAELWGKQQHLEEAARRAEQVRSAYSKADTEADPSVPAAMADALRKMPPSIAAATRSVMKGARIRGLVQGAGNLPVGHPVNIALPSQRKQVGGSTPAKEEEKPRSSFQILRGLMALCGQLRGATAVSVLAGGLGFAASMGMVVLASAQVLTGCFTWNVAAAAVFVIALGAVRGPLRYAERLNSHNQTFRVLALIRSKVFEHMRKLSPARMEQRDSGDAISLLTNDISQLETFYARTIAPAITALAVSLAVVALFACQHWLLAMVALVSFLLVGVAAPAAFAKMSHSAAARLKERSVRFSAFMYESLAGLPETLRFGAEELRRGELGGRMGALSGDETKLARGNAATQAFASALVQACCLACAGVAVALVSAGQISGSVAAVCIVALFVSFEPVEGLAKLGFSLQQTIASGSRILAFLDEQPETPDVAKGEAPSCFTGASADKVTFSYGNEPVLEDFSARIEPGQILHVAGPSGAGKSTFLKLLMRVWDVEQGAVRVSDCDVRKVQTECLRTLEGSMTQTTHLFSGTVRQNIMFVRPDATEEQLQCAVSKASLSEFVQRLPKGLDTPLGEIGEGLSEGERQRVGLARIFLYDAPFLLLDEPTSNLDSLNEAAVLSALQQARAGKTMVVVSHRMSAAAFADETLVIDQGRLS